MPKKKQILHATQPRLLDVAPSDPIAKGKSVESLLNSRNQKEELEKMFRGDIPASIMAVRRDEMDTDPVLGSYEETKLTKDVNYGSSSLTKVFQGSASGKGAANGALSIFARNICRTVVLLYSKPGDMIVDPFIGHNSRMGTCVTEGRHYHGYDVSKRFMRDNYKIAAQLHKDYPNMNIELNLHTSERMVYTPDNYGDFTVTSPPYWDIEDYGDEPEQLGKKAGGYQGFLDGMLSVAKENYRVLKPGAYCVYYINDFRRNGKFYPYHVDMANILQEAGFIWNDIMIVDLGRAFRESFVAQIVEQKLLPKRHEYGLVMRKP